MPRGQLVDGLPLGAAAIGQPAIGRAAIAQPHVLVHRAHLGGVGVQPGLVLGAEVCRRVVVDAHAAADPAVGVIALAPAVDLARGAHAVDRASNHSASRIAGSMAGAPPRPATDSMRAYSGARSIDCTNAHTLRAAWSGASNASRSTARKSTGCAAAS
jgi:hypothetical protein